MSYLTTELLERITEAISQIDLELSMLPLTKKDLIKYVSNIDGMKKDMNIKDTLVLTNLDAKKLKIHKLIYQALLNPKTNPVILTAYRSKYLECITEKLELLQTTNTNPEVSMMGLDPSRHLDGTFGEGIYLTECNTSKEDVKRITMLVEFGISVLTK